MQFHHAELTNRLTLVGETNPAARSVAVGFFVRTGARDEIGAIAGVTHFLEHMIFKGTPRRTALDVNRDFDRIGASYNAYTSEENTVFHAAILPEYVPQAVDILADILRPSLRGDDFDMEKNVIIEEIEMYEDQPMWAAYEAAKTAFFGDHPLGHSVLGTKESIQALTRDQMHEYYQRRYVAPNITVAVAGNIDWPAFVKLMEDRCGDWPAGPTPRAVPTFRPADAFKVVKKDSVLQEHAFLLSGGPPVDSPLRFAAEVLANALGDDTGSRLYWALVDPGLADGADCSYHEYEGAGAFFTYLSGEADRAEANLNVVLEVLRDVQRKGLTDDDIRQSKSKLGSRVVRGNERPMGRMQALGFYWTYLHEYRTVDQDLAAVDAVTAAQVRRVLDEYPLDRPAIIALGPLASVPRPA